MQIVPFAKTKHTFSYSCLQDSKSLSNAEFNGQQLFEDFVITCEKILVTDQYHQSSKE